MKIIAIALMSLTLAILSSWAMATGIYTCKSGDRVAWKSISALKQKMTTDGWQVRHIKEDGGCYEAYGTTPDGQRVEAYFHPVTLEKMLVARRGQILFRKPQ